MGIYSRIHAGEIYEIRENTYQKLEEVSDQTWGSRGSILSLGKPIDKINFFSKPRKIQSSKHQVKLIYGWMLDSEDRRTRVVGKAYFVEVPKDSFQAVFDFGLDPEATKRAYKQRFYQYQTAMKIMNQITENKVSQYILTNPVYAKEYELLTNHGRRTIDRLTEMHVVYCEIDQYSEKAREQYRKLNSRQIWRMVKKHLIENNFPLPTEVIFSRGLQLWWKHGPIPAYMIEEWRLIMKYINHLLSEFGADADALDPVRVLRAVGSIHEKTGEKIEGQTFTNDRYDFMELFNTYCAEEWSEYLLKQQSDRNKRVKELEKNWIEKHKWMLENGIIDDNGDFTEKYEPNKKKKRKRISEEAKVHRYTLRHKNIIDGVFWLSDRVRHGNMFGCKEFSCYLVYAMALRVTGGNVIEAQHVTRELFDSFISNEYDWEQMLVRICSAEMDYKRWLVNESTGIKYKTETLITKLHITPEEMKKMRFIVTPERSAELKTEYDRIFQKNRYRLQLKENGKMTKKEEKEYRAGLIKDYLKDNPGATQSDIANKIDVNQATVSRLIKEFKLK